MRWKDNHILSVAIFLLVLTLIFFGRALVPAEGWALGGLDIRGLFYPWFEQLRNSVWQGRFPWWDENLFAGYPFLSNPQVAAFYPLTWLAILPPIRIGISLYLAAHLWLGGLGMFLFVQTLATVETERYSDTENNQLPIVNFQLPLTNDHLLIASLIAAVTFMFSGFFTARIYAGHIGLIAVHTWVPWILLGTVWSIRRGTIWSAVVAGLPFGMAILAGHTTSLLYVGLIWGCFIGFQIFRVEVQGSENEGAERRIITNYHLQIIRQITISGVIGLLLAMVQLLPLLQFTQLSGRTAEASYEFATGFSFPPTHLITLLVPEFFGEPTRAGYWSVPNFEELTAYAGILPLLVLLVALKRPTRQTLFWVGMMVLGILLAFGSYGFLYKIFYDFLPPFRLARAPGRAMFLYLFSGSVLLGLTLNSWWQGVNKVNWLKWVIVAGSIMGITAIAATGAVFASQHPTDTSGRLWHQLGGWTIAAVLFVVGGYLWLRSGGTEERRSGAAEENTQHATDNRVHFSLFTAHSLLLLLVIIDLWLFGYKFVRTEPMTPDAFWFEAREVIGETDGRVLPWGISIFSQNGAGQVGLESVFGYNALEVGANSQLAASVPDPRSTAYDILGAHYVVATSALDQFTEGASGVQLVGQQGSAWVYARPLALPLVRLVSDVEVITDNQQAIERVHQPDFDPSQTVILAENPACEVGGGGGSAEILERRPGYWRIATNSDQAAMLVVSETAYPGWEVTIDGQAAVWQTAYTAVRAVCVPAGEHLIEWKFRPRIYWYGGILSLLALCLVIVAMYKIKTESR